MAYTSGRTVKSRKPQAPTTVASATRDARRLVTRHLPADTQVTVDSAIWVDPKTLATGVRTVLTYPETADSSDLAIAVEGLAGYASSTWTSVNLTIIRTA